MMNTHPKNAVRWRPDSPGFYKPKAGATKMKWHFKLPYVRERPESLIHYPEVSRVTDKIIDWYHEEPDDGYHGVHIFGENTLELKGMPMGRTPEYMQERLRRFFSKFGPVRHCRAEPHPLDPYQCEGTAYITFRDRDASLKALKAPLKFPASLHDKVIYMKHLDTDKRNDPDYYEKGKFWNNELISLAKQLYMQLSTDTQLRANGMPLSSVGHGLMERELLPVVPELPTDRWNGRGGIPLKRGGLALGPTRNVSAKMAVRQRFGSWQAFLAEPPFDEFFSLELSRTPVSETTAEASSSEASASSASESGAPAEAASEAAQESPTGTVVVRPRLVTAMQRSRILIRAKMMLAKRLHDEFSIWWREGKVPLPEYTQTRIKWWDHKPQLPFELQILSRSKDRHRIHDERFLYRRGLIKARSAKRAERRAEWKEEKQHQIAEKRQRHDERRSKALSAVEHAKCGNVLGLSRGLVPPDGASGFNSRRELDL